MWFRMQNLKVIYKFINSIGILTIIFFNIVKVTMFKFDFKLRHLTKFDLKNTLKLSHLTNNK
jgi:hypothetical protein